MHRYFSYASVWRHPVATTMWLVLVAGLVAGRIRFLPESLDLTFFGAVIPIGSFIYIFLAALVAGAVLVYLAFKTGRTFCSCVCPYHQLLELTRPGRFRLVRCLAAAGLCFLVSWSLGHFVGEEPFNSVPSMAATLFSLTILAVLLTILLGGREYFCRRVCPYGVLQMLPRNDSTLRVVFRPPGCTNCRRCDSACPMRLNVRKQSAGHLCTNCTRCICRCRRELGVGDEVLLLTSRQQDRQSGDRDSA